MGRLPPVSSGHGRVYSVKLSRRHLRELERVGRTVVRLTRGEVEEISGGKLKQGETLVVRPSNVYRGRIYVYLRSTGELALRNFPSDRRRGARHMHPPGKPQTGDTLYTGRR